MAPGHRDFRAESLEGNATDRRRGSGQATDRQSPVAVAVTTQITQCAAFSRAQLVVSRIQRNGSTRLVHGGRRAAGGMLTGPRLRGPSVRRGEHAGALGQAACCRRGGAGTSLCKAVRRRRSTRRAPEMRCWRRELTEKVCVRLVHGRWWFRAGVSTPTRTFIGERTATGAADTCDCTWERYPRLNSSRGSASELLR